MKASFLILAAAGLVLAGCGNNNSGTPSGTNSANATSNYNAVNIATAPVDYLATVTKAGINTSKTIDTTYLNAAVERFLVQEGHYPKDLNELVPNYVAKLPPVPYGMKLDYDPNTGQVKVVKE